MSGERDYQGSIVVGSDGSATARAAVDWAATRAARLGRPLAIVAVLPDVPTLSRSEIFGGLGTGNDPVTRFDDIRTHLVERLKDDVARVKEAHPGLQVEQVQVEGEAGVHLARATRTADLVVIGARGHSAPLRARALGGTADAVTTHAYGPVVVIPQEARQNPEGPVVVGVDSSMEAEEAIRLAVEEAASTDVPLLAVHTWDPVPWVTNVIAGWTVDEATIGSRLDAMVRDLVATHASAHPGLLVQQLVRPGHAAGTLIDLSREASMVVVGSRGRGGFAGLLLGSTSHAVLRGSSCPVLVTRAHQS